MLILDMNLFLFFFLFLFLFYQNKIIFISSKIKSLLNILKSTKFIFSTLFFQFLLLLHFFSIKFISQETYMCLYIKSNLYQINFI